MHADLGSVMCLYRKDITLKHSEEMMVVRNRADETIRP